MIIMHLTLSDEVSEPGRAAFSWPVRLLECFPKEVYYNIVPRSCRLAGAFCCKKEAGNALYDLLVDPLGGQPRARCFRRQSVVLGLVIAVVADILWTGYWNKGYIRRT